MSIAPTTDDNQGPSLSQLGKYLIIATAFLGWFFGGTHMAINGLAMRTAALNLLAISGEGDLTDADRAELTKLTKELDKDADGTLRLSELAGPDAKDGTPSKADLKAAGLVKDPDGVKILGKAGDKDGVISAAELQRYVIDARLGGRASRCAFLFGAALGGLVFGRIGDRFGRSKGMAAAITCYSGMSLLSYFVQSPEQLWIARFITCMGVGGMWPNGVALMSEAWKGVSRPMLAGVIGTLAAAAIA